MMEAIYQFINQQLLMPMSAMMFPADLQAEGLYLMQTSLKVMAILSPVLFTVAYFT